MSYPPYQSQYQQAPYGGVSYIRGEGPRKQAQKLNLGHTNTTTVAEQAPQQQIRLPTPPPEIIETVREKKVYRNVETLEEKNIIAEAFAKMALLIMENKRLKARLQYRAGQLAQLQPR